MSTTPDLWVKDPDAVLDYAFDWTAWLSDGETISSHTVTVGTGITVESQSQSAGVVTVWLSGGTAGTSASAHYSVACRITTNQGRTDERTKRITVRER